MGFHRNTRVVAAGALWAGLGLALVATSGCASAGRALGMAKVTPDEFRVVAMAPLALPPDYGLRPPAPGEPRPQELQPESQARAALLGQSAAVARSEGENLLAAKAGADRADPLIRYVVDDEFGALAHKDDSFVDRVLSFDSGAPVAEDPAGATQLTGGQPVIISGGGGAIKLPGL